MKKLVSLIFLVILFGCNNRTTDELDTVIDRFDAQLTYGIQQANFFQDDNKIFPRTYEEGGT
jgi:Tfp pilus assembly protein PilP